MATGSCDAGHEACHYMLRRFQMECAGKISPVGNLAIIGAGASGLLCSHTQTR
jgi:hypothetical protein